MTSQRTEWGFFRAYRAPSHRWRYLGCLVEDIHSEHDGSTAPTVGAGIRMSSESPTARAAATFMANR